MLLWLEIKKILFSPIMIGAIFLCVLLNMLTIPANSYRYELIDRNSKPYNAFEGLNAADIADMFIGTFGISGDSADMVYRKYEKLQPVIDEKAKNGDALSIYFGEGTTAMHRLLFLSFLPQIFLEIYLIALLASLMSVGYEHTRNTDTIICSSKTGRKISRIKLGASLITGMAAFIVILGIGLIVYFTYFDYSEVWNDNISSSYNYYIGMSGYPFITWRSYTVMGYLIASILLGGGLTMIFCLIGFAIGTFFRSAYIACLATFILCILQLMAPQFFSRGGIIRSVLNLSPIPLWLDSGAWFTDGGAQTIWANFESIGLAALFILLTTVSVIAIKHYKRRELF